MPAQISTSGTIALACAFRFTAVLTISDDGPGIPPEARSRVFERFTRLDDARHGATGGTGLGLAIARDVIRRHGGTITVDPETVSGARFVIKLPVDPSPS